MEEVREKVAAARAWQKDVSKMPKEKHGAYFRPVSVTMYCIMVLTAESLIIFTLLAVFKNAEELAGFHNGSLVTETLQCASRSATYPPMMCMLFLACRMYVLATTEGLGEPPLWVKTGMVIATLGMTFQFLVIFLFPFVSEQRTEEGLRLSELSGEPTDVHPQLWAHKYHNDVIRMLVYGIQAVAIFSIYGGLLTVVLGIITFPAQTTQISPAVQCTVALSILYFGLFGLMWVVRTRSEVVVPMATKGWHQKAQNASLSASMMMKKVPMFAVVFLAARMRALQLDPPHGALPPWAQACIYMTTLALCGEALAAAYIGATGQEDGDRAYFGAYVFTASPVLHAAQHLMAIVAYLGMIPVVLCMVLMSGSDGEPAVIEPATKAALYLAALFFCVYILQTGIFFYEDLRRTSIKTWAETVIGASAGVSICPLLAVLFLAARMRALQITQQQGAPPHYAQHCMCMCVFASVAQFVSCLVLPLFTGRAGKVDEDGQLQYDMHPMVQAYFITVVRYVGLVCMHGGAFGVCVAIMTMTPRTAIGADKDSLRLHSGILHSLTVSGVVILVCMVLSSAKVVGLAVKIGIETVDEHILGVQITVGKASLDILRGAVSISGLVVYNPDVREGNQKWQSPYLLKCERVLVDISTTKLLWSFGKVFEIQEVRLEEVTICYDQPKFKQVSNVKQVIEFISGDDKVEKKEPAPASSSTTRLSGLFSSSSKLPPATPAPASSSTTRSPGCLPASSCMSSSSPAGKTTVSEDRSSSTRLAPSSSKDEKKSQGPQVIVEEVSIRDISAAAYVKGICVQLKLADVDYDNFNQRFVTAKHAVVGDVVKAIVMTLLKTIIANHDIPWQALKAAGNGVMKNFAR